MNQTNKKFIKTKQGYNIYYEIYSIDNQPPQAILLHGVGGDLDAWQYVKDELLIQGISTLALDLRGHGFSSHPRYMASYQINYLINDIREIITQEKLNNLFIIGHCYGAVVAEYFALNFPEILKGLALISGTYRPPLYLNTKWKIFIAKFFTKFFAWISPPPIYPGHSIYPINKIHKDYEIFGLVRTIIRNSWGSYLLTTREILNLELKDKLKNIKIPTLILVGDKDSIFPLKISQTIHQEIKNSKLEIIPNGLHNIVLNNVTEVSQKVCKFIITNN